jgi:hypothetical protein
MSGGEELPWLVLVYPVSLASGRVDPSIAHVAIDPATPREIVETRVRNALAAYGIAGDAYCRALEGEAAKLCHSYVSIQQVAGKPRLTTYLAPRFYGERYGLFFHPVWPTPLGW